MQHSPWYMPNMADYPSRFAPTNVASFVIVSVASIAVVDVAVAVVVSVGPFAADNK